MMKSNIKNQTKRYAIWAKRNEKDGWSMWAEADELERATHHLNHCQELGFIGKIVEFKEQIKDLAKELCEESGCHHKCKEIDECVVMEEAEELLINGNKTIPKMFTVDVCNNCALLPINENKSNNSDFKSNNFDVKSNEELFKQALVEGVNRNIDKTIEEAKKIEQIEEMAQIILDFVHTKHNELSTRDLAEHLYNAGCRKQNVGEWIKHCNTYECSVCKEELFIEYAEDYDAIEDWSLHFCPNCGSKMKGGAK